VDETEYWFNIQTGEVEVGKQSLALFRIGPFSDFESAARALEIIAARTAHWQDDDEAYEQVGYSENDSSADGKTSD
jgi:hypothetical protein